MYFLVPKGRAEEPKGKGKLLQGLGSRMLKEEWVPMTDRRQSV